MDDRLELCRHNLDLSQEVRETFPSLLTACNSECATSGCLTLSDRGGGVKSTAVALSTSILKRVTSQTGSDIQHRRSGVGSSLKDLQRHVAPRQLIVAATAIVRRVAGRAIRAIQCRILAVNVVLPSRGVRGGLHQHMARRTLVLRFD